MIINILIDFNKNVIIMKNYLKYAVISIILASFIIKAILVFFNEGLWWDEAVYLGLGRSIQKGIYSLDNEKPLETFRAPFLPFVISPFSWSIEYTRVFVVFLSLIAVFITYYISKKLLGEDVALFASLFLSTNQLFVFFTGKVLSEPLFMIWFLLSLLFFMKKGKVDLFLSGLFFGFALITRYIGFILLPTFIIYFIFLLYKKRNRESLIGMLAFFSGVFLGISLALLISYFYYGNILTTFQTYAQITLGSVNILSQAPKNLLGIFEILGLQIFFVFLGFWLFIKEIGRETKFDKNLLLLLLFIFPLIFTFLGRAAGSRYLLSFLPLYCIFSGFFVAKNNYKPKIIMFIAIFVCVFSLFIGSLFTWNDRFGASSLVKASIYLKEITQENDTILSQSYPYVYYITERKTLIFPSKEEEFVSAIKENKIRYVLLYKFEEDNPDYVEKFLSNNNAFQVLKKFEQWGDENATIIYEFKE